MGDVPAGVDHDPSYNPAYDEQYTETEHPRDDQEFSTLINSKMTKVSVDGSGSVWHCCECDYSSRVKCNVTQHVEAKHIEHEGYYCYICNKTSPSKNAFRMHNKRNHSNQLDMHHYM